MTQNNYLPALKQRFASDMLPVNHDYWDVLNLVPPSEEGMEQAQIESARRLMPVRQVMPFADGFIIIAADILSQVLYKNQAMQLDLEDPGQQQALEAWHFSLVNQNREIVKSAFSAIIATLLEADVLALGEKAMPGGLVGGQAQG